MQEKRKKRVRRREAPERGKRPFVKRPQKKNEDVSAKPELLAPAGNLEGFFSALSAGADAVYIGLPRFNARMRADNFSVPDLAKLVPYAHSLGRKVYITLNTQILEDELPSFIDLVSRAYFFSPDAFIVGDLGALEIVRRHFPRAEVHASTMMGNFNARILDVYGSMGVKRAILERHLDFDQVKEAVRRSPIEVEVFVHGAMCYSYSGRCFFSSFLGGKSGNRGECVQPCRRVFHDELSGSEGSYFSTKDLSLMRMLPALVRLGVRAFKIEGRMREADYIFDVVSAYRKAIDMICDDMAEEGIAEGEKILERVIGRARAGGVISGEAGESTVASEISGAVGEFVGKVEKKRGPYVLLMEGPEVKKGERLRVQDQITGKGTGFTLLSKEQRGTEKWIKVPFDVRLGDLVYRVSPRRDRKKVTESAGSRFAKLPSSGIQFSVAITDPLITVHGTVGEFEKRCTFRVEGGKKEVWKSTEQMRKVLVDSYGGDFPLGSISFQGNLTGGIAFDDVLRAFEKGSKSVDKSLHLHLKKKRVDIISSLKIRGGRRERKPTGLYAVVESLKDAGNTSHKVDYVIVPFTKSLVKNPQELMPFGRNRLILSLPLGQSDVLLTFYRAGIKKIAGMGFGKFLIPDIGWVKVFREVGISRQIELISDHYIYAFNTAAGVCLQKLGISKFILPLENTLGNLERGAKFLKGLGILPVFLNVPLMVSRLRSFRDSGERWVYSRMGEGFKTVTEARETVVFSEKKYSASGHIDRFLKLGITDFLIDLRHIGAGEREHILDHVLKDREIPETSTFNLFRENF